MKAKANMDIEFNTTKFKKGCVYNCRYVVNGEYTKYFIQDGKGKEQELFESEFNIFFSKI